MNSVLTVTFGVMSFVSLIVTVFYGRRAAKLQRAKKTLTWYDMELYTDSVSLCLKKDKCVPHVILAPGMRGGVIAELLLNKFERDIPVFVGISHRHFGQKPGLCINDYEVFAIAGDWDIFIPKAVFGFKDKRILIVDDFCLTGEFFERLRTFLVSGGFDPRKIRVYCCAVTTVTKSAGRAPEYYSKIVEDDYIYFPWGKANMG